MVFVPEEIESYDFDKDVKDVVQCMVYEFYCHGNIQLVKNKKFREKICFTYRRYEGIRGLWKLIQGCNWWRLDELCVCHAEKLQEKDFVKSLHGSNTECIVIHLHCINLQESDGDRDGQVASNEKMCLKLKSIIE